MVDLGAINESDQVIVFNFIDHLGVPHTTYEEPLENRWNIMVETIEFTVYGSNDFVDALEVAKVFSLGISIEKVTRSSTLALTVSR